MRDEKEGGSDGIGDGIWDIDDENDDGGVRYFKKDSQSETADATWSLDTDKRWRWPKEMIDDTSDSEKMRMEE